MRRIPTRLLVWAAVTAMQLGCGGGDGGDAITATRDRIAQATAQVISPEEFAALPVWRDDAATRIPLVLGTGRPVSRTNILKVAFLQSGTFVVAAEVTDAETGVISDSHLWFFDPAGAPLRRVDFPHPSGVMLGIADLMVHQDTVLVVGRWAGAGSNPPITLWLATADGNLAEAGTLPDDLSGVVGMLDGGALVAFGKTERSLAALRRVAVVVLDEDGWRAPGQEAAGGDTIADMAFIAGESNGYSPLWLTTPYQTAATGSDRVWLVVDSLAEAASFDADGNVVDRIRWPTGDRTVPDTAKLALQRSTVAARERAGEDSVGIARSIAILESRAEANPYAAVAELREGPGGKVYIRSNHVEGYPRPSPNWLVIDRSGAPAFRIELSDSVSVRAFGDDAVVVRFLSDPESELRLVRMTSTPGARVVE